MQDPHPLEAYLLRFLQFLVLVPFEELVLSLALDLGHQGIHKLAVLERNILG